MLDTVASNTTSTLRQNGAVPLHSGEYEAREHNGHADENRPAHENEQLLPRSYTTSTTKCFFTSFFAPKDAKVTSMQTCPSETTPLLVPPITHNAELGQRGGDGSMSVLWEEVRTLIKYALPLFGTHLLEHSIAMSSVIFIGHISTIALAAVTIGFMSANVTGLSIIQGMASALDTIVPSAWTSDQPQLVGLWIQRMAVLQLIVLIPIYAIWFNAETILLAMKQDPEVAQYAGIYLRWAMLGLPAYAFNCISRRYFQAQGLFYVPTRIIVIVAPINILTSYLLVWGPDSIRLGFIGAPIATSISYTLISVASITYGVLFVERTAWHPISSRAFTSLGLLARLSVGAVGQVASEWWSWELVGLAASLLGPIPLAAQSVLLSTISSTFQVPCSVGIAASVRIGNLLGEKNASRASAASHAALLLCNSVALFLSAILVIFRAKWGYMFNSDPGVVALVAAVLPVVAIVQLFDNCSAVTSGILRARGKQTLGATINISAYYCIGFPIGFYLAFVCHWGLFGLWWGLTIAMACVTVLGTYLCLSTDWHKEVDKAMARLAVDKAYEQERRDEEYTQTDGCGRP